jgi:hypothetical protein
VKENQDLRIRSHVISEGEHRAPNRAMLRAVGFTDDDFKKPMIGVASTWSEVTPCNMHINKLAEKAKEAVRQAAAQGLGRQREINAENEMATLNDLIERRIALLRQQMKEDEERVRRLPAGKETEVEPRLAELRKQIDDVQAKLHAYRDAPREKAAAALGELEKSLAALTERRRELDAQLKAS